MNYKLILLFLVVLFIGANLLCSCCQYPVFDYLMGNNVAVREGNTNSKDVNTPGSSASVNVANADITTIAERQKPVPEIVAATAATVKAATNGMTSRMSEGFLTPEGIPELVKTGMNVITGGANDVKPRIETIPVNNKKEGMALMGSDVNEVQNSDVAGMWVSKANTYASEFGYGIINNTGSAYTADEPLKNGELVLFAKNKFKPECCPAPYSSSTGCVCMTPEQINYLNTRGGNRSSDSGV